MQWKKYNFKKGDGLMQPMSLMHSREIDIFYNEHKWGCTNCEKKFINGMCAHLGYLQDNNPAVLCDDCSQLLKETVVRYHWQEDYFDKPNPDDKLWRYMDLGKLISIISRKELYFSSADTFDDPFEGAKGVEERKSKWDEFYLQFFREAIRTIPGTDLTQWSDEEIESNAQRMLKESDAIGLKNRKNTYVSCWYGSNYESEAMWKLYSMNVTNAVAIQTTAKHLYEALDRDPYIDIGKIRYIDYRKQFAPVNGAYWYKRKAFEHEREVRAVFTRYENNGKGVSVPVNIETLIDYIYISPYAPKWFEDVVHSVADKYDIKKPIKYSEINDKPFF